MSDVDEAAKWMLAKLKRDRLLDQEVAVAELAHQFGDEATTYNDSGNLVIAPPVLRRFRKLTAGRVVWSRSDRAWRWKDASDGPGRLVD